jgi:hypothetical protein
VHAPIGKVSFGRSKLLDNAKALIDSVLKAKPAAAKGKYVKSIACRPPWVPGCASTRVRGIPRQLGRVAEDESDGEAGRSIDGSTRSSGELAARHLVDFRGLSVPAVHEFRRKVTQAGSRYRVVKNTLALRAVKDTPLEKLAQVREHHRRGLHRDDPVALAKVLVDFAKEHPQLEVKAGVVSGARCSTRRG